MQDTNTEIGQIKKRFALRSDKPAMVCADLLSAFNPDRSKPHPPFPEKLKALQECFLRHAQQDLTNEQVVVLAAFALSGGVDKDIKRQITDPENFQAFLTHYY